MVREIHSHAHEEGIPGTVNLKAVEGDDTYLGQALFPVPSTDPNDPLNWPKYKRKIAILTICALYSFLGNASLLGPSVYIAVWAEEFGIDFGTSSGLISYSNLAYGFGSLIWIPMYMKFGRRPVMILTLVIFVAALAGCSAAQTYPQLMALRVLQSFGSGVCEALPVQLVNEIFFLHERASRIGFYTVALCLGSTGPLYAGYMLNAGYSWRLYFWVCLAFAGALLIAAIIFVEESMYIRTIIVQTADGEFMKGNFVQEEIDVTVPRRRKTWSQQLKLYNGIDHDISYWKTTVRPFTYLVVPAVFWVIATYGIVAPIYVFSNTQFIGLGALSFNYTFPIIITSLPYNWSQINSGLIACAGAAGFLLSFPLTFVSDWAAAKLTRRNGGIREAEMRLTVLFPAMVIAPAGLICYGMTAQNKGHWFGYMAGVAMTNWGGYFYFTNTLAYAMDSYNANVAEMLVIMNLGKQAISFGMGYGILDWVLEYGYDKIIAGAFTAVLCVDTFAVIGFYFFGKRLRKLTSVGRLARMHQRSIIDPNMTH